MRRGGLRYNSLALIDNYANGLEGTEIDFAKFKDLVKSNQEKVNRLFTRLLEILALSRAPPPKGGAGFPSRHSCVSWPLLMKTIGVIGLGIIGGTWAKHYAAAGVLAGCWNRTPQPAMPHWKDTPEAVAAAADAVQIVVADPPAVQGVLDRILPRLGPGKVVIQSTTIDPASSDRFRAQVEARGARYLEAPFTGSKPAAEQRKTVYYLGGPAGPDRRGRAVAQARVGDCASSSPPSRARPPRSSWP